MSQTRKKVKPAIFSYETRIMSHGGGRATANGDYLLNGDT